MTQTSTNTPDLWLASFPWPTPQSHKYIRGHAIIAGGELQRTGAAKLAARAALRIGAGAVSVTCDRHTLPIYAASFDAVMTRLAPTVRAFAASIADPQVRAVLVGPGTGISRRTKRLVRKALASGTPIVLDADVFSVFRDDPAELFTAIAAPCILTPHEGEFSRLFGALIDPADTRPTRAANAAQLSGSVVILKGNATVIAAPDGRTCLTPHASPFLATAGSGDVLAGFCTGLLAQGMPPYEAACAAVWLHAEAGGRFGPGLTAADITGHLPALLQALRHTQDQSTRPAI